MDLIYGKLKSDKTVEDINVLLDYSFDEIYGIGDRDINDFELKVQKYNNRCTVNNVVYIEFTEYGGIIDRIENDSKTGVITYKGRTWHGILNSYVIQPSRGYYCKTYSGEINSIMAKMVADCGLSNLFVVDAIPQSERSISVAYFTVRYEKLYDAIIRLLNCKEVGGGKMLCYFHDGQVHIGGVRACDYSISDEFDTSQMPYKTGVTFNNVNHLICIGGGEEYDNKPVIHLFADESGIIQPYKLVNTPLEDSEYILDERKKVLSGMDEIMEIYNYPSASTITNYKRLTSRPNDWNRKYYEKYYENGEKDENGVVKKKLLKQVFRDEYKLLTYEPSGWRANYTDYFKKQPLEDSEDDKYYRIKNGTTITDGQQGDDVVSRCRWKMASVKELTKEEATTIITYEDITYKWGGGAPPDWESNYSSYYMYSSTDPSGKVKVSARTYDTYGNNDTYNGVTELVHNGTASYSEAPADWATNYMNLTTRVKDPLDNWVYGVAIQGVPQSHMERRDSKSKPEGWKDGVWKQFYIKVTKKSKLYKNKNVPKLKKNDAYFVKTTDAIAAGELTYVSQKKKYPKYDPKKYWYEVKDPDAPPSFEEYTNGTKGYGVFIRYSHSVAPQWDVSQHQYFQENIEIDTVPPYEPNKYYILTKSVEQIPEFWRKNYYYAVYDRIKQLVEAGLEKFEQLKDTTTLDVDLELDSNYDVGDVMGLEDDITKTVIRKPILRKIIKIKKDILSVDYEVM